MVWSRSYPILDILPTPSLPSVSHDRCATNVCTLHVGCLLPSQTTSPPPGALGPPPPSGAAGQCMQVECVHIRMVTRVVLRPLTGGAPQTLVPILSLKICITCPSCTDEPLKPVSGDLSLRGSAIFAQKVNSEYSCVRCEVHQLTEMCDMQRTV